VIRKPDSNLLGMFPGDCPNSSPARSNKGDTMRSFHVLPSTLMAVLLFSSGLVQGQTFHLLTGGGFDDRPSCIEKTIDNGYIISGDQSIATNT